MARTADCLAVRNCYCTVVFALDGINGFLVDISYGHYVAYGCFLYCFTYLRNYDGIAMVANGNYVAYCVREVNMIAIVTMACDRGLMIAFARSFVALMDGDGLTSVVNVHFAVFPIRLFIFSGDVHDYIMGCSTGVLSDLRDL